MLPMMPPPSPLGNAGMGPSMAPPQMPGGFQPPMSPDAIRRQMLMQMLDPSGGMPVGTTEPKAYPPPMAGTGRRT